MLLRSAAVLVGLLVSIPASAQNIPRLFESAKILPADGLDGISDLARDDEVLVLGLAALGPHPDAGAYVVERGAGGTWSFTAELVAGDLPAPFNGFFGLCVAVDDDVIVVGAHGADGAGPSQGAAYVFERVSGTWTLVQKVVAPGGAPSVSFGRDVDLEGARLVVGDPDVAGGGVIHVFERTAGTFVHRASVSPPAGSGAQWFGYALDLDGDRIAVGAPGTPVGAAGAGAVFVVEKQLANWNVAASLAMSGAPSFSQLGLSVALDGDVLVAGAPYKDLQGRAVVYERSGGTWLETQQLTRAGAGTSEFFGEDVAIDGDFLVVNGAASAKVDPELFLRLPGGWFELCRIHAQGSVATGRAVVLDGSSLLTGAYLPGNDPAIVAEFDLTFLPHGTGCPGSNTFGPRMKASGDPSPNGDVTLSIWNGTSNAPGLLLVGNEPGVHPNASGCTLLVSPLPPVALPFSLGPVGSTVLSGPIPPNAPPGLVTTQALLADPLKASGLSATTAIVFEIP